MGQFIKHFLVSVPYYTMVFCLDCQEGDVIVTSSPHLCLTGECGSLVYLDMCMFIAAYLNIR